MAKIEFPDSTNPKMSYPWYAVQVRANHELTAADHLRGRGYTPFVPLYKRRTNWSDRIKVVDAALFPGYLFCRLNPQDRLPILSIPQVIQIIGNSRVPIPLDEVEIQSIQALVASGLPSQPWPYLRAGERVRIERGPLSGLEGTLLEVRGNRHLVLSVTLLQRSVAVEIEQTSVRSVEEASFAT
jgi:transcription antitermination factor NusG